MVLMKEINNIVHLFAIEIEFVIEIVIEIDCDLDLNFDYDFDYRGYH